VAQRKDHRCRSTAAIGHETEYILSKSEGDEIMTELMWFTVGFVATLAIITIADTIVRCRMMRK
jgi:hypothetical protein